ncbi:MAG: long-chain acyl-CoA synthetase, partial [Alteromonadaceae bacterium]
MMDKIWLQKSYPPGVPFEIDPDKYGSIVDMFDKYSKLYQHNTAFINMGAKLSYQQLAQQSQ